MSDLVQQTQATPEPQAPQAPQGNPVDRARAAGYTDDQINAFLAPKVAAARAAGYTQEQVNQYLGIKTPPPFDEKPMRDQLNANLAASPQPVTSVGDALAAGWQMSTAGLIARGKPPEKVLAGDAPMMSRLANGVAMMGGDIPAMIGGFAVGGGMTAETGPGAAVGGMAGAFALPTALRRTLMDSYEKGQFHNFSDFWDRAAPIFLDTAKSYITGAATGAAGKVAGAVLPEAVSPTTAAIAKTGAEIGAMTTVGKALEGQVPTARDFADAAVLLGGLKFAGAGAVKLREIYAQTGVKPSEVVADAQSDVSIQQDLASKSKVVPDAYRQRMAEVSEAEAQRSQAEEQQARPSATAATSAMPASVPRETKFDTELSTGEPRPNFEEEVPPSGPEPTEPSGPARATPLDYEKEPERLASFVKRMGGVIDEGGDVRASLGGAKYRPGLINQDGMPLDRMAEAAWQAGYFPEFGENRPSINDLRDALDDDLKGRPRYSSHDQADVQDYHAALDHNNEVLHLSSETGIPTHGMTREQFFDRVANHYSTEEMAARQTELDQSSEAALTDLERQIRERGIEPNDLYGQPRSLEDMENAYREESAARAARQGIGGNEQRQPAAGTEATGEGGGGPGGRAPGATGGAGPEGPGGEPTAVGGGAGGGGGEPPVTPPTGAPPPEPPPRTPGEAQERILSHMSVGEATPKRPWSLQRVLANIWSDIYPIEAAAKRLGGELPTADDPGRLASMMAGSGGITERFVNYNTLDFRTGAPNGPALKSILDSVPDKDMDGFRAFIAARHALNLDEQGIQTGFDLNAARMVMANGARFSESADAFTGYLNRVSAYLRDAGVLSQYGYDAMISQRPYYVPFQRVMEHLAGRGGGGGGRGNEPFDPIKAMVGSQRMVVDPVESAIRNTALFVQMAERNVVGTKLIDLLLPHGEAERTELPAPPRVDLDALRAAGVNTDPLESVIQAARPVEGSDIQIFRNGQAENYRVDPELAVAMKGLDGQSAGMIEKMLRPLSQTLRAGAVLQPDFMARHTIRDYLYAFVTSPGGFSPWWMVRGIAAQIGKTEDYQNWLSSGGGRLSMISLDRQYLQHSIDELAGTGILDRAWNVLADPTASTPAKAGAVGRLPWEAAKKFLISPMQMGVELAENASHVGQFIRTSEGMREGGEPLTKEQLLEAGYQSRRVAVDAGRIGASMRAINAISAFANITVQDTARVVQAFREAPMATALKVGIAISLPSVLTWMNGHEDSRYKEAPAWQRDLFWVIPTDRWEPAKPQETVGLPKDLVRQGPNGLEVNNGITWRIPKPWGMGLIFGSGVERLLGSFQDHAPHAFKDFANSIMEVSLPNMLPNAVTPLLEQFANRSLFTNRTLVPDKQEKWLPEYQFTPYTSETAKAIGRIIGGLPGISEAKTETGPGGFGGVARGLSSPILLENYLRAWTGNLGMYALETADYGLRKAGVLPDPPKPASTLADIPFVKAFNVRMPTSSSESIQNFHDTYSRNKTYFDTWMGMARQGDVSAMQRIQAAGGPQMMVKLDSIQKVLGEQSKLVQDIYKNPQIKPEEKRQLIDTTYWRMTELARVGNQAMEQATAAMTVAPQRVLH